MGFMRSIKLVWNIHISTEITFIYDLKFALINLDIKLLNIFDTSTFNTCTLYRAQKSTCQGSHTESKQMNLKVRQHQLIGN